MIARIIVLGAAGDLAARLLLPGLASLCHSGHASARLTVLGIDRQDWDGGEFRARMSEALARHAAQLPAPARAAFAARLDYAPADATDPAQLRAAIGAAGAPVVVYLALPPAVLARTLAALSAAGLPAGSRLVIEKPFGQSAESAVELNRLVHRHFAEDDVFRVDHFLAKQTVQNLLGLRFANRVLEPLWSREHIARVDIVWDETLALEGRAGYYDRTGALRDMIQSHLLQLLALVAMEPPATLNARDLRDRKVEALRAIRRLSLAEVDRSTARARYGAGSVDGRAVPAYVAEPGVDPDGATETFAHVRLLVDNWRWAGVPFHLRTGKALAVDRNEIAITFCPVPHLAFGQSEHPVPNVMRLSLGPDRLGLSLNINGPGDPFSLERAELAAELADHEIAPYGRVLLDVLEGDPTLAIRGDEAEESWRVVEPILAGWAAGGPPLVEYRAGSAGPPAPPG